MVSTDIIRRRNNKYYYRSKSIREGEKVRKIRKYLGKNLSKKELKIREKEANYQLADPLNLILKKEQVENLNKISQSFNKKIYENQSFYEWFVSEFTYHSDAIEGNSLTLKETAMLLFENITPANKHPREIYETINHKKATDFIFSYSGKLDKKFICKLQKIVVENTLKKELENQIGKYRDLQVFIRGANFIPTKTNKVEYEMKNLISWYNKNQKKIHPIVTSAYFHAGFESIHPFVDGNGRVGRLLMNWMLYKNNFPMITIKIKERLKYYESLENARNGKLKPLVNLVYKKIKRFSEKIN